MINPPVGDAQLTALTIGDDAESWVDAGFLVEDGVLHLGRTRLALVGSSGARGIVGVSIDGIDSDIDGLAHMPEPPAAEPSSGSPHPNGARTVDHLVVMTPDCDRTTTAYGLAGLEVRGVRHVEVGGGMRRQTFFWLGDVILELIGSDRSEGDGPAKAWGLALVCDDLEASAEALGERCGEVKPAVQPGRYIATLRTKPMDISVPIALMSPHPG